ncbi:hypothetical protein WJX84_002966 [Apatococcus fuscideae]|uniref:Uncharacterized protein n=1 Tax=Apatococcus fuscideae TaxID=2026836 RepID=A0AAW1SPZ5_9CHLO
MKATLPTSPAFVLLKCSIRHAALPESAQSGSDTLHHKLTARSTQILSRRKTINHQLRRRARLLLNITSGPPGTAQLVDSGHCPR